MAVNLIVLGVTLLVMGFIAVWLGFPQLRPWMEQPKHRFLDRQHQFPAVTRGGDQPNVAHAPGPQR
jgi:hypothetical protein